MRETVPDRREAHGQIPTIIIVTGHPATGKSAIARRLAHDLALPLIAKDDIKERLFDTVGWNDRAWSRRLGIATYALIYHFLAVMLEAGYSAIAESNFDPTQANAAMRALQERHSFRAIQVLCHADGEVLIQRFLQRDRSGERHPGHVDRDAFPEVEARLRSGRLPPLDLPGPIIEVDTTDFAQVRYDEVLERVRDALRSG